MEEAKQNKLKEIEGYLSDYSEKITTLQTLIENLENYNKEIINLTFFKKYYTKHLVFSDYPQGNRDIQTMSISEPRYDWQKHNYRIAIKDYTELELQTRNKTEILEKAKQELQNQEEQKKNIEAQQKRVEEAQINSIVEQINNLIKLSHCEDLRADLLSELKYNRE
jgi:hypothetical protein